MRGGQTAAIRPWRRFYGGQNVLSHIEKSTLLDDVKRREREAKERASEANMLDQLYQVRPTQAPTRHARSTESR